MQRLTVLKVNENKWKQIGIMSLLFKFSFNVSRFV